MVSVGFAILSAIILFLLCILGGIWMVWRRDKKDRKEIPDAFELTQPLNINERRFELNDKTRKKRAGKHKGGKRAAIKHDQPSEEAAVDRFGQGVQDMDSKQNHGAVRKPKLRFRRRKRA